MNLVIDHLECLLRRYDCVTVPGIGALMVRYRPARFDSRNPLVLLPPSREIAFNGALVESDGLLENSVARKNGISFEAASRIVKEETESLLEQLKKFGSIVLGRLGELIFSDHDTILFYPYKVSGWDFCQYGLRPIYLKNADTTLRTTYVGAEVGYETASAQRATYPDDSLIEKENRSHKDETRGRLARNLVGVAASLAVIVTLALFFLNPVKVENEPLKASIAPTEAVGVSDERASEIGVVSSDDMDAANPGDAGMENDALSEKVAVNHDDAVMKTTSEVIAKTEEGSAGHSSSVTASKASVRFNESDPYCVVIASFPTESQAMKYLSENHGKTLGVLHQDGKYRVYAATGASYEEAATQKSKAGESGAWICRR